MTRRRDAEPERRTRVNTPNRNNNGPQQRPGLLERTIEGLRERAVDFIEDVRDRNPLQHAADDIDAERRREERERVLRGEDPVERPAQPYRRRERRNR